MGKSKEDEVGELSSRRKNRLQKRPWEEREGGTHWKQLVERTRKIVDKSNYEPNGCYPLDNRPTNYQEQDFKYATLRNDTTLKYDCFMPTGETYEFLPCAPHPCDKTIGYKMYRGTYRIMDLEGPPQEGNEDFMPYKLLLYKGRDNENPGYDDWHRFVYLAENKPREPLVGDCFVRLEEIHKRMKGAATDYAEDCARYNERERVIRDQSPLSTSTKLQKAKAAQREKELKRQGNWTLRFRCWTVDGKECTESESRLRNRLFHDVYPANNEQDHLAVFKVWAELLRSSQGDKLAAKDFFGRYWDAAIPEDSADEIRNGFRIIVGAQWFQNRRNDQVGQLDYGNPAHREIVKVEVYEALKRAIDAPRLKFKPRLDIGNIFFDIELNPNPDDAATDWDDEGWRCLDGHPGGLYHIVVNKAVRDFLNLDTHKKPFWQEGYGYPEESNAKNLNDNKLDLCRLEKTGPTRTLIDTNLLSNLIKKRNPTQDRCVATKGYSANLAMSDAFRDYYPVPAVAKRRRVAEWLHRSAFSYGGYVNDKPNNSQTANNLVLGTPDTNTVMMRYEAFVKRLVIFSGNGQHGAIVITAIQYPALEDAGGWMGDSDHQYTWLAPHLKYRYYSITDTHGTKGHVDITHDFFPFNRESCLLFQSILDKSVEAKCWGWNCWNPERAVVDALLEAIVVDGDKEEANKEEATEKLREATAGDQEGVSSDQVLNDAVLMLV